MSDLQRVGPSYGGTGTAQPFTSGITGAQRVSDAHGRYLEAVRSGNTYMLSTTSVASSAAFPFAAAGTPLLAVYNPVNSNKMLVIVTAGIAVRTTGSVGGNISFGLSMAGVTAIGTGTQTSPTSAFTFQKSGSVAQGFINTALTSNTLSTGVVTLPICGFGAASATASLSANPALYDIAGLVVVTPGTIVTLGCSVALSSSQIDATLYWEEVPYLQ